MGACGPRRHGLTKEATKRAVVWERRLHGVRRAIRRLLGRCIRWRCIHVLPRVRYGKPDTLRAVGHLLRSCPPRPRRLSRIKTSSGPVANSVVLVGMVRDHETAAPPDRRGSSMSGLRLRPHPSTVAGALALGVAAMGFSGCVYEARALAAGVGRPWCRAVLLDRGEIRGCRARRGRPRGRLWPIPVGGSARVAQRFGARHRGPRRAGRTRTRGRRSPGSVVPGGHGYVRHGPGGSPTSHRTHCPRDTSPRFEATVTETRRRRWISSFGPIPWTDERLRAMR